MNILILSFDYTMLYSNEQVPGDTRYRHISYAREMNLRVPGSKVFAVVYAPRHMELDQEIVEDGLFIYPTNSLNRALFAIDALKIGIRICRAHKIDLVTTQSPFDDALVGLLLKMLFDIKLNVQLHADFFSRWWVVENPRLNSFRLQVAKFIIKRADSIRVVSTRLKEIVSSFGIPEYRVYVVPVSVNFRPVEVTNPKELCKLKKALLPQANSKKTLLFVGRLALQKNLPLLIQVAENILQRRDDVIFIIVGDGPERQAIEELIQNKGLDEKVILTGNISYEFLPNYYAVSDLFVLSSIYEGFGRVLVEAYLSGIPAIATDVAGPSDIIVDGQTGFIVPINDVTQMVEKILFLLDAPQIARDMGQKGKRYVSEKFNKNKLKSQLIDMWLKTSGVI